MEQYRDLATYESVYCQKSRIGELIKSILNEYHKTNKTLKMNVKIDREGNAYFTNEEKIHSSFFQDSSEDEKDSKLTQI